VEYILHLDDSVSSTSDYHTFYEVLRSATPNDVVKIVIANYGGRIDTCISLINAIRCSDAEVIGVLSATAYSAAGAIFLACDRHEVQRHSSYMGHDAQGGEYGSLTRMTKRLAHDRAVLRSLYEDVFKHFLTQEEIEDLLEDRSEVWLTDKDIVTRLQYRAEQRKKEFDEEFDDDEVPEREFFENMTKEEIINWLYEDPDQEKVDTEEVIVEDKAD
jgi:ATP-dependent Clp protease protease subunit